MKGISELLTTVIIILIAVSIGTAMAAWSFTLATTTAQSTDTVSPAECSSLSAAVKIREVFAAAGQNSTVRIMVENTGYSDNMTISSALAYNTKGISFAAPNLTVSLNRGESAVISIPSVSLELCPYSFDRAIVTTGCPGVFDSFEGQPICG